MKPTRRRFPALAVIAIGILAALKIGIVMADPPIVPAVPEKAADLARETKEQFERGDFAAAEKTCDQALALMPDNPYLLSNMALILFRQQKYESAAKALKKVIAIRPKDDFSHTLLGFIEYQQGKLEEAASEFTKALAINPTSADARAYLDYIAGQKSGLGTARKASLSNPAREPNFDGPGYKASPVQGDYFTPLERGRFLIPSGKYELPSPTNRSNR